METFNLKLEMNSYQFSRVGSFLAGIAHLVLFWFRLHPEGSVLSAAARPAEFKNVRLNSTEISEFTLYVGNAYKTQTTDRLCTRIIQSVRKFTQL